MLATKGVFGEQRPCPVATVRIRGEDGDHTEYKSLEGEETPVAGKDGDAYPLERTYVLKAGPEVTDPFSMGPSIMPGPVVTEEQVIEACLKETLELCTRDVQGSALTQSPTESEDEGSFLIPEEPSSPGVSTGDTDWTSMEAVNLRMYRTIKSMGEKVE
jgi:hypothetical protein